MASNAYRQQYKRKWIAANRVIKNGNSATKSSVNTSPKRLALPTKICTPHIVQMPFENPFEIDEVSTNSMDLPDVHNIPNCPVILSAESSSEADKEEHLSDSDSICLEDDLINWVNSFQVKHNAVDSLLKILKQSGHPDLPSTARSLLSTARVVNTQIKSGMEYLHFPLADVLLKNFHSYPPTTREHVDYLEISINIDGIPLFKSSRSSLWPVLCGIMNLTPIKVFPVTLTYGVTKPENLDFLHDIVQDLNLVMNHGLKDGDKVIKVFLRCVVCDAPAKAMVKATKLYSGYHGCDKCNQAGVWVGRMTYPDIYNVQLRTDASFRNQSNEEHHHRESPFCAVKIDMVKTFPIDYMHQLCLGVMKKLIIAWKRGKKEIRISSSQLNEISRKLIDLRGSIPNCFARKPRSLLEVERWKATEFRQFLLYTGKVVLKGILSQELFDHFITLSIAASILMSPNLVQLHLNYAKELLKYFVEKASQLYGEEFIVYNVHSLVHLADDAEAFGSLDKCSGFPFENYLQKLKRYVRSGKNPIAQITKRLSESVGCEEKKLPNSASIKSKHPNNGYIYDGTSCCVVVNDHPETDQHGSKMFLCRVYNHSEPMFLAPCDSRLIGVHKVCGRNAHMKLVSGSVLTKQAIVIELVDNFLLFMAILHEF